MIETPARQNWPDAVANRRERRVLALVAAGLLASLPAIDTAVHELALPGAAQEFGMSSATRTFAAVIAPVLLGVGLLGAGALGDRLGRRRMMLGGSIGMAAGWLVTAFASDTGLYLLGRMLTGVSAAANCAMALAVVPTLFFPAELARVFGLWLGIAAAATAAGYGFCGAVLAGSGWRDGYLLALAPAAVFVVIAWVTLPDSRAERREPADVLGFLLCGTALGLLVLGFGVAGRSGWGNPAVLLSLPLGVVAAVAFVRWELQHSRPAFPVRVFAVPTFTGPWLTGGVLGFAVAAAASQTTDLLQQHPDRSPSAVVVLAIPMYLGMMLGAVLAAQLLEQGGSARGVLVCGLLWCALGTLALVFVDGRTELWIYGLTGALLGFGVTWTLNPQSALVTAAAPPDAAGSAAALKLAVALVGSAVGPATMPSVATPTRQPLDDAAATVPAIAAGMLTTSIVLMVAALAIGVLMHGHRGRTVAEATAFNRYRWIAALPAPDIAPDSRRIGHRPSATGIRGRARF